MNEAGLRKTSKDLHVVVDDLIEQVAELDDLGDVQVGSPSKSLWM